MAACLVFDFDGTIVDTERPLHRSWVELWSEHGEELALTDWQHVIGVGGSQQLWAELERRLGRPLDPALDRRRRARFVELQATEPVRPGVLSWLAAAEERSLSVGIASSAPTEWVESQLARLGLRTRFACVVGRSAEVPAKPDPSSYRLACARLGGDPARSVAVEDSALGVAAARAAGLFTVAVPHPLSAELALGPADLVVGSLDSVALADALARAAART